MTLQVTVEGGTDAGRKPPFMGTPPAWECDCQTCCCRCRTACCYQMAADGDCCGEPVQECCDEPDRRTNPGYLRRCPDCGTERPE